MYKIVDILCPNFAVNQFPFQKIHAKGLSDLFQRSALVTVIVEQRRRLLR